jgi:DNA replication protein DnaC
LEARKSTSSPLPGFDWVDASACDQKALHAVRYHVGEGKPVLLYGQPGGGKTAIAATLAIEEAERLGREHDVAASVFAPGIWMPATAIVALIQKARTDKGVILPGAISEVTENHIWERLSRKKLLVVDDLGVSQASESAYAILWRLADIRQKLPTIYTSNLTPQQLREEYDDRIASRVCCGVLIELVASDRRIAAAKSYRVVSNQGA